MRDAGRGGASDESKGQLLESPVATAAAMPGQARPSLVALAPRRFVKTVASADSGRAGTATSRPGEKEGGGGSLASRRSWGTRHSSAPAGASLGILSQRERKGWKTDWNLCRGALMGCQCAAGRGGAGPSIHCLRGLPLPIGRPLFFLCVDDFLVRVRGVAWRAGRP